MVSLKKELKIAISPYGPEVPNRYIDRMVEAIRIAFPYVTISAFPRIRKIFSLKNYDFVWFNWFENPPVEKRIKEVFIKWVILITLRLMGIKIIMTFHNRMPHESKGKFLDRLLFRFTFTIANRIIILSADSKLILKERFGKKIVSKLFLIPHPTYDCEPKKSMNHQNDFSVLFFGNLRPYKNIELIYEIAKIHKDIKFTIAGNAFKKSYELQLKTNAKEIPNIKLVTHFLTEKEIDKLIDSHSILLLPYDIKSSLNSGVVIHAICKRINIIVPQIGTVNQLKNKDLIKYRREDIGFVFQFYNLVQNLTAKENVELATEICNNSLNVDEVIEKVGLKNRKNNFPSQLSGGEQQRVAIARAIAKNPKLLLCDEPTGALDYQTGKQILKLLQDTCRNEKMTIIIITHNSAISPMADKIIKFKNGSVSDVIINENPTNIEDIEW